MERKIFHNLIYSGYDKKTKEKLYQKIKEVPKEVFDTETRRLIVILDMISNANKEINETTFKTYLTFYKGFDYRKYFFSVNEDKIDLETAVELFVKERIFEHNKKILEKVKEEYEKTADESLIENLEFKKTTEENLFISSTNFINRTMEKFLNIKEGSDKNKLKLSPQFFRLDVVTHGFEKGELILIAARPSVGKSMFAISLMNHFSKKHKTILISYEMTAEEIGMRMLYAKAGVYSDQIYHKDRFTDEVYERLSIAGKKITKQEFEVVDSPPSDFITLRDLLREKKKKENIEVILIDYLGLIREFRKKDRYDPYLTTSEISANMKLMAKELDVVIILLQQVSRKMSQGKRTDASYEPLQLTDLRDSGTLEQDANKVFLLWNETPETEEEENEIANGRQKVIVYLAKNRGGKSNHKFQFLFNKGLQRITEEKWLTAPNSWEDDGDSNV